MSLSRCGEDLARAVAGELYGSEEAELRRHLAGCDECRARYDALTLAARALRGSPEPTQGEVERAEARLFAALDPQAATSRTKLPIVWWALGVPVAAAMALAVFTTFVPAPLPAVAVAPPEVALRGGSDDAGAAGRFSVQLYARPQDGGAVRLAGEFPGSGEVRVSAREWLQVTYAPDRRGGRVFAVGADGQPRALPSEGSLALAPGTYRVWALRHLSKEEAERLESAPPPWPPSALPVPLSDRVDLASGVLEVVP